MNAITETTEAVRKDYRQEYRADIGDREIYATVKRYGGGYNDGQTWVTVEEFIFNPDLPGLGGFNKFLFDYHHQDEPDTDFEALRQCIKEQQRRLKTTVRNWNQYRYWASLEKGGKRAYYTKHANEYKARIPAAAAQWKLAKQLWKEITKL